MATTLSTARTIALSLPATAEKLCHGTPAFYVRNKLMARLQEDGETLSIAYPKSERAALIEKDPDVFSVTDHFLNYDYVLLDLHAANEAKLRTVLHGAWEMKAGKKLLAVHEASEAAKLNRRA